MLVYLHLGNNQLEVLLQCLRHIRKVFSDL